MAGRENGIESISYNSLPINNLDVSILSRTLFIDQSKLVFINIKYT